MIQADGKFYGMMAMGGYSGVHCDQVHACWHRIGTVLIWSFNSGDGYLAYGSLISGALGKIEHRSRAFKCEAERRRTQFRIGGVPAGRGLGSV